MQRFGRILAMVGIGLMVMLTAVDFAEARRGGAGFGSRGTRTFSTAPTTRTAPTTAAPIERTMTPNTVSPAQTLPTAPAPRRPGLFGGFGGSMLGGLMMGGLIGMLLGNGLGGGMGFLGMLLQIALVFGAVSMAMRFFGRRGQTAQVGASSPQNAPRASGMPSFTIPRIGETAGTAASRPADEIGVQKNDLDHFQTMLADVQAAYGAEDFPALRRLTTPEAMSYLAEELGDNATQGVKNDVRDVRLLAGRCGRGLARRRQGLCDGRDALRKHRRDARPNLRCRRQGQSRQADRGSGTLDLSARARRRLARVGDPGRFGALMTVQAGPVALHIGTSPLKARIHSGC